MAAAVLSAALHSDDLAWAEQLCVRLAGHAHEQVRGNAVLGLGHLARRFGRLTEGRVAPLMAAALHDTSAYVRGQAAAAADDLEQFLGWKGLRGTGGDHAP